MIVTYLDASAVVKLMRAEAQTATLERYLTAPRVLVSSRMLEIELSCVAHRQGLPLALARGMATSIMLLPLDERTIELAQTAFHPPQRTLDAIHLATALQLGDDLDVMVSYDVDQADAARRHGIAVEHPGAIVT